MNIGFYVRWDTGSLDPKLKGNINGDELIAVSFCKYLKRLPEVAHAQVYGPNHLPDVPLDFIVHMNDTDIIPSWANKHVMYFQNGFEDSIGKIEEAYLKGFDGYMFYSRKLLDHHLKTGRSGIFLEFGVDFEIFKPTAKDLKYTYEVAYVGNDIKGVERTKAYIWPATAFKFALYGNWCRIKNSIWRRIERKLRRKTYKQPERYQRELLTFHKGKIAPEECPKLYSTTPIILNCTLQGSVDQDVFTLRTLEVLACGGFLITDRVPSAEALLKDCVVFTDGGEDLKEKIAYYLKRPEEREHIAKNGYQYALQNGGMEHRSAELLKYLKTLC